MKKSFLAAGILLITSTVTFAQNNNDQDDATEATMLQKDTRKEIRSDNSMENETTVNDLTENQFAIDFPKATNVHFVRTKNFNEVSFTQGKKEIRAYYDDENQLAGTTQKKAFTDLPQHAQTKILEKYAGYTIASVIRFDDNESNETDMTLYENSFSHIDSYFVELKNDSNAIVLQVDLSGDVSFFTTMK
ncbi:MAG TPA: hypothetical protein VK543_16110 [Puia sp.]|nr:hypothetical protein [Puia sp.]